jgi:hypothetical protein
VTLAVAIKVPAGALSAIVALAGDSVIAVGVGLCGGGAEALTVIPARAMTV